MQRAEGQVLELYLREAAMAEKLVLRSSMMPSSQEAGEVKPVALSSSRQDRLLLIVKMLAVDPPAAVPCNENARKATCDLDLDNCRYRHKPHRQSVYV